MAEGMEIDSAPTQGSKGFSFNLLQLIKTAQSQHGLRHNDHKRYRKYCTDRLRRLYKSLKFTHGRGKFVKRSLVIAVVNDVRHLHIALYSAERAWSYAMDIKETPQGMSSQQRYHLLRRMKKACKWADLLQTLCSEKADARTGLEALAYASYMRANLLFETRSNWSYALKKFKIARTIYEELSRYGDVENQLVFRQRVEEIEPNVRYCGLMIEQEGSVQLEEPIEEDTHVQEKLQAVVSEAKTQQEVSATTVEWLGLKFPVENNKTRACVLKAQEHQKDLQKPSLLPEKKAAIYDKLFALYQEARKDVREDIAAGGNAEDVLSGLDKALSCILFSTAIQRAYELASAAKARLKRQQQEAKHTESLITIRDLVGIFDTLITNMTELEELTTSGREIRPEESVFASEISAKRQASRAERCFYLAHSYSAMDKHTEAFALFGRAIEYAQLALESLAERDEAQKNGLQGLLQQCRKGSCLAHARSIMAALKSQESLEKGVSSLAIEDGYLMDHLDRYKSALGAAPTGSKRSAASVRICQVPPAFKIVPCRPVFNDTALNDIDFPSLDARLKKMKDEKRKSGFLGRWW